ncbi:hypothetical protein B566_EDAN006738 [Ephemera danica]|nr:hypothetical protein B566_EDAN006738 [Ephemera danica]
MSVAFYRIFLSTIPRDMFSNSGWTTLWRTRRDLKFRFVRCVRRVVAIIATTTISKRRRAATSAFPSSEQVSAASQQQQPASRARQASPATSPKSGSRGCCQPLVRIQVGRERRTVALLATALGGFNPSNITRAVRDSQSAAGSELVKGRGQGSSGSSSAGHAAAANLHPLQERDMIISKDLFLLGDQDYLRLPKDDKRAMVHKTAKRIEGQSYRLPQLSHHQE